VNGCQTSNILFQTKEYINGINIPFRLIGSKNDDFITSIIIGTNSQNVVKDEQFWALKPFMKDLEEYFGQQAGDRKLYLERRENQYRSENVERTRIVKPSELIKSVAATYLLQPHRAARDFRGIRNEYSDKLFLEDHNVMPYHAAAYAAYRFDYLVRNKKLPRRMNIYKYYILAEVGRKNILGREIFTNKTAKISKICGDIMDLVEGELDMIIFCTEVAKTIENLLNSRFGEGVKATPRERIRDALRSDTFASEFLGP
jgi:hypothetical protein